MSEPKKKLLYWPCYRKQGGQWRWKKIYSKAQWEAVRARWDAKGYDWFLGS